jgi:hypothetical protein
MRLISFSLWGHDPKYTVGAVRNAELAPRIYPGWRCRFHCGRSVDDATLETLRGFRHVDVVMMDTPGDWNGMFWRFAPAADPDVSVMLSRDTDSRLSLRERAAVDAWLASGKDFHAMRDHPQHGVPILGGMWGVRNGLLREIQELIAAFPKQAVWQVDQWFLAAVVHPRVRERWLEHDPYFARKPFPTWRRWREFVGQPFDAQDRPLISGPTSLEASLRHAARRVRDYVRAARGRRVAASARW